MNNKKNLLLILLFTILTSSVFISAQTNFEGKITFQVKNKSSVNQISYLVKGEKYRIEPKAAKGMGIMLYDNEKKIMTILLAPRKMYMEMPFDLHNKKKDTKKELKKKEKTFFKNTGKTKKIHGYNCEKFEFINKGKKGEAWMAKGLGGFLFFRNPNNKNYSQNEWEQAIIGGNYFPMVISEINSKGEPIVMFEVLEIKEQELPNSLFTPPADYQKFDMSKMMDRKK